MKTFLGLVAIAALLAAATQGQARGSGGLGGARPAYSSATTIPAGVTVGPQVMPNGGSLTNNGQINGGSSTGVTALGSAPVTITNNGVITSSTQGVSTSGNSSSTITNTGTISVQASSVSTAGSASAQVGAGVSQTVGP